MQRTKTKKPKETDNPLTAFLLENNSLFKNKYGVSFDMWKKGGLTVSCWFPGFVEEIGFTALYLWKEFQNMQDVMASLSVAAPADLENVTPAYLHSLFDSGKMDVSCYVEKHGNGHTYIFTKEKGKLFVFENSRSNKLRVKQSLTDPYDFIGYSRELAANASP